ncbi:MAG: hypothetical protein H7A36_02160 [Chlamydiales bacterium]|nr:hypothetical protein [Chlamydiales bacterium]
MVLQAFLSSKSRYDNRGLYWERMPDLSIIFLRRGMCLLTMSVPRTLWAKA